MTAEEKALLERPIPGITGKQLIALIVFIVGCAGAYIDVKNATNANYDLMIEIKEEFKQDRRVDDTRLKALDMEMQTMQMQLQEVNLRLNFFEKFVEGYNKPQK